MSGDFALVHAHPSVSLPVQDNFGRGCQENLEIKAGKLLAVGWVLPISDLEEEPIAWLDVKR